MNAVARVLELFCRRYTSGIAGIDRPILAFPLIRWWWEMRLGLTTTPAIVPVSDRERELGSFAGCSPAIRRVGRLEHCRDKVKQTCSPSTAGREERGWRSEDEIACSLESVRDVAT